MGSLRSGGITISLIAYIQDVFHVEDMKWWMCKILPVLRDISTKDWPRSAFSSSFSMIKLLQCREAVSLLFFSANKTNFAFFCRSGIFFRAFSTLSFLILGTMRDIIMLRYDNRINLCDASLSLLLISRAKNCEDHLATQGSIFIFSQSRQPGKYSKKHACPGKILVALSKKENYR